MSLSSKFGVDLHTNKEVYQCQLINSNNLKVSIINYGAIIRAIHIPDAHTQSPNIVLGFDDLKTYQSDKFYLGAQIGPLSNRVSGARIHTGERVFNFAPNEDNNLLHGGFRAFNNQIWDIDEHTQTTLRLSLEYTLPDQDLNFKSNLDFGLNDNNVLSIEMNAISNHLFPLNLTRHEYFNLRGEGNILDHDLQINAHAFSLVDQSLIPTGHIRSVFNTPYDFNSSKKIRQAVNQLTEGDIPNDGFDNNFILDKSKKQNGVAAILKDGYTKRTMVVHTTQPCLQLFTGQALVKTSEGAGHDAWSGLCLEAQGYPDASNQISFPNAFLEPSKPFKQRISYAFEWV